MPHEKKRINPFVKPIEDTRISETTGNSIAGNEAWFRALDDSTDVNDLIIQAKNFGCTGLKLYADISAANAKRIIEAAKQQKIFPYGVTEQSLTQVHGILLAYIHSHMQTF